MVMPIAALLAHRWQDCPHANRSEPRWIPDLIVLSWAECVKFDQSLNALKSAGMLRLAQNFRQIRMFWCLDGRLHKEPVFFVRLETAFAVDVVRPQTGCWSVGRLAKAHARFGA